MLHSSDNKHHSSLQLKCSRCFVLPQSSSGKIRSSFCNLQQWKCVKGVVSYKDWLKQCWLRESPGTAKRALRIQFAVPSGAARLLQIEMCSHYAASRQLSSQRFRPLGSLSTLKMLNFHSVFLVWSAHSCRATPALLGLAP